ncbi:TadE/TadG family type IV pilus assembly protein [Intrasporangium sp. YIM S08009]|uniref:TadE/TadG family type IV pilus assembly protein n=1 Tax=Intrasporangium zincisolvens TaxID=3080018 RepID=UPI002B05D3AC|nr:TadE/TadG family type IV pilus assembly protein [Intrasporangium sp. YIM S08009]
MGIRSLARLRGAIRTTAHSDEDDSTRQPEQGATAVEFAMLAPVLFLLLFGIIVFGFLFAQNLALSNAARQAARYAVVDNSNRTCGDVVTEAVNSAQPLVTLPSAGVTVKRGSTAAGATNVCSSAATKPCAGSAATDNIYVTVAFDANVMLPVPGLGNTKRLTADGVFRCEFS